MPTVEDQYPSYRLSKEVVLAFLKRTFPAFDEARFMLEVCIQRLLRDSILPADIGGQHTTSDTYRFRVPRALNKVKLH